VEGSEYAAQACSADTLGRSERKQVIWIEIGAWKYREHWVIWRKAKANRLHIQAVETD